MPSSLDQPLLTKRDALVEGCSLSFSPLRMARLIALSSPVVMCATSAWIVFAVPSGCHMLTSSVSSLAAMSLKRCASAIEPLMYASASMVQSSRLCDAKYDGMIREEGNKEQ